MCLAQGHKAVTLVRLESAAPLSPIKHSTIEPLCSPGLDELISWTTVFLVTWHTEH